MSLTLYAVLVPFNGRINKNKIAATIAGLKLDIKNAGELQSDPMYKQNCQPLGASPVLATDNGYIFESNAILRYIARLGRSAGLYGSTDFEAAQVDSWLDFCATELDEYTYTMLLMNIGAAEKSEATIKSSNAKLMAGLEALDKWLEIRTFLVGERITAADACVFATLDSFLRTCPQAADAYKYKNVIRHYMTVLHQAKVQEALKANGSDALIPAKPKEEKPAPAKKEEKPKKEAKPAAEEEEEPEAPKEEKKPNPLDLLPPSKFVLDAFKREYSNTDTRSVAAPYFFDNFDAEGFTCFWCNYKYNEENKMQFMTANLVRGWFQRMEHCRKYAFGVALLVGEDKEHDLTAFWCFRGKGLPEIVTSVDDSELFTWTEIADIKAEKELITDYLCWEGPKISKPVLEGRCFK